jgi:hypothetical protein
MGMCHQKKMKIKASNGSPYPIGGFCVLGEVIQ